jgi:hypothetical protein
MITATFGPGGTTTTDTVSKDGSPEQIVVSAPRPNSTSSKTGPGIGAALSATAVTGEGAFGPESLLPALPTAGEVLGGLAALVTSPVAIAAAILGGVLFPNSTAADDTLDGRTFTTTPPPPNVLPGGPPVALPPPAPFPAPAQQDQGAIIRPGGGPVPSLPPLTFPAQEGQGPQIRSGNTVPVQLPNVVFNDAADNPFGVPPSIVRLPPERPSGLDERHEGMVEFTSSTDSLKTATATARDDTVAIKNIQLLHSAETIGRRSDLAGLSDEELLKSVINPRNGDHVTVDTDSGKVVDGNSRIFELQNRAKNPSSSITQETRVPVVPYTRDLSMFNFP